MKGFGLGPHHITHPCPCGGYLAFPMPQDRANEYREVRVEAKCPKCQHTYGLTFWYKGDGVQRRWDGPQLERANL